MVDVDAVRARLVALREHGPEHDCDLVWEVAGEAVAALDELSARLRPPPAPPVKEEVCGAVYSPPGWRGVVRCQRRPGHEGRHAWPAEGHGVRFVWGAGLDSPPIHV